MGTLIAHVADRRADLFTAVKSELNAAKVVANEVPKSLASIFEFQKGLISAILEPTFVIKFCEI